MTKKELDKVCRIILSKRWFPFLNASQFEIDASKLANAMLEDAKNDVRKHFKKLLQ